MIRACPKSYALDNWQLGWDVSTDPMVLDPRCLSDAKNFNIGPMACLQKRSGIAKKYDTAAASASVHSLYEYKAPNGNSYLLVGIDTKLTCHPTVAWVDLKTGLTAGKRMSFVTHQGFCYVVNGNDDNFKLYNTTAQKVGITPPTAAPTVAQGDSGTLTGKFKYVYCYRRNTPKGFTGNPSTASTEVEVTTHKVKVSVVASSDPQVDKIVIYRTLDLFGTDADSTMFFQVTTLSNATQDYQDDTSDNNLTSLCDTDNDVPPKAKFITLHKDRVVYAYLPANDAGTTEVMYSKAGIGEAVPAINYQYFDRDDGEPITGIVSFTDQLVIFKRNKFAVIPGDFEQIYTVSTGIGCIAPWAILVVGDKLIFLSEEGWKAWDGRNLYSLSSRINSLVRDGYVSINQAERYSAVYYPTREQFYYLCNHTTLTPRVFVGHFILPLMMPTQPVADFENASIAAWTYHQYDNHTLTAIGTYTTDAGLTEIVSGTNDGYIYVMDSGVSDDGANIECRATTGWLALGSPVSYTKSLRLLYVTYVTQEENDIYVSVDVDGAPDVFRELLTGVNAAYCGYCYCGYCYAGVDGNITELLRVAGQGQYFRYTISNNNTYSLSLLQLLSHYRLEGLR